jgi:hypothetical protein
VSLELQPISLREARAFVTRNHRHHKAPQGGKFAIATSKNGNVVGVVIVGLPVSRMRNDGWTAEVTRLCTLGDKNACSMLYSAAWRAAKAMGYRRMGTYILSSEDGTSLRAAGWRYMNQAGGGSWSRTDRARVDDHPLEQKQLWEAA